MSWKTYKIRAFKYLYVFISPLFTIYHIIKRGINANTKDIRRILVIAQNKGIGDAILYSSAVRAIRKEYPDSVIKIMCTRNSYKIVQFFESIDFAEILEFDFEKDLASIKDWNPDAVVDFYAGFELYSACLAFFSKAKSLIGFDFWFRGLFFNVRIGREFFTYKLYEHFADMCMSLVKGLTNQHYSVSEIGFEQNLFNGEDKLWAGKILSKFKRPIIALQPGARDDLDVVDKRWPLKNYGNLALEIINSLGCSVLLLGDSNDVEMCKYIEIRVNSEFLLDLCGKTSINQTASLLKNSDLLVCNNSGILHIANALNVSTISFSGGINLSRWKPYYNNENKIMFNNEACYPGMCFECPMKGTKCFAPISVERVMMEIRRFFN